ncbi:hypothetical protein [Tabrizicola flagellatus]|uniref:hypothetical protein n=1 Tax=Tabrizicola flagellatus TaxID=2593021 RepID=UPI0011F3F1D5|nr:hypothetical protein [Tabrizicola flagellatus]
MIYLFIGMALSGINARLTLLAHRGGFLLQHEAQKSFGVVLLEFLGFLAGMAAFIVSFFLFSWWIPPLALAIGYWLIAPFLVNRQTFATAWQARGIATIGAITCSVMLLNRYFEFF